MSNNSTKEKSVLKKSTKVSQKGKVVGLTLLTSTFFIVAVTTPVVLMNQWKSEISTVKSNMIQTIKTTDSWNEFYNPIPSKTQFLIQVAINQESANWMNWIQVANENGDIKNDAIASINSIIVEAIDENISHWKVIFDISWKDGYRVASELHNEVAFEIENQNIEIEWVDAAEAATHLNSILSSEPHFTEIQLAAELNKIENQEKLIQLTNHRDILESVSSSVVYGFDDQNQIYWEVVSSFTLKESEKPNYIVIPGGNQITTNVSNINVIRQISPKPNLITVMNSLQVDLEVGASITDFFAGANSELNSVMEVDLNRKNIIEAINNSQFIDPNSLTWTSAKGERGNVSATLNFEPMPGFTLSTTSIELQNIIIKQNINWTWIDHNAALTILDQYLPRNTTQNWYDISFPLLPPESEDTTLIELNSHLNEQLKNQQVLQDILRMNSYETPDGSNWRESVTAIDMKFSREYFGGNPEPEYIRNVQVFSITSNAYTSTLWEDDLNKILIPEQSPFFVPGFTLLTETQKGWMYDRTSITFGTRIIEIFQDHIPGNTDFSSSDEAEDYYNNQALFLDEFNRWLNYNQFHLPTHPDFVRVAERYQITFVPNSVGDLNKFTAYFEFYPSRPFQSEDFTWWRISLNDIALQIV